MPNVRRACAKSGLESAVMRAQRLIAYLNAGRRLPAKAVRMIPRRAVALTCQKKDSGGGRRSRINWKKRVHGFCFLLGLRSDVCAIRVLMRSASSLLTPRWSSRAIISPSTDPLKTVSGRGR